jgi:membrane-associated phospholipid phosphatase
MTRTFLCCQLLFTFTLYGQSSGQNTDSIVKHTDSVPNNKSVLTINTPLRFSLKQTYVPGVLALSGIATTLFFKEQLSLKVVEERNEHFLTFHTSLDNYLQYAPIPIAYGLDLLGIKSKNNLPDRTAILLKGEAVMFVTVNVLKYTTRVKRPDGDARTSFPSGHTAQAFAAATFLSEEYKDRFKWMPYAAYGLASTVGIMRMANNRHYIGDVLMGAGLGILSMKLSYWSHQYKWGKKKAPVTTRY